VSETITPSKFCMIALEFILIMLLVGYHYFGFDNLIAYGQQKTLIVPTTSKAIASSSTASASGSPFSHDTKAEPILSKAVASNYTASASGSPFSHDTKAEPTTSKAVVSNYTVGTILISSSSYIITNATITFKAYKILGSATN